MTSVFLFCAVVGGTVLVCQFVLTLVGLGGHSDVPDDLSADVPHDFHGMSPGDGHSDGAHGDGHAAQTHLSSWLFGVVSFRTLVAAATFFGLTGLAVESAQGADQRLGVQLLLAGAAGAAAMYGVHWIMQTIGRLGEDGTVRVQRAIGQEATVYVPIPAARSHAGKVQLKLQNRLVEYEAVTAGAEKLATGVKVRVVGLSGNTLEVEPLIHLVPQAPPGNTLTRGSAS